MYFYKGCDIVRLYNITFHHLTNYSQTVYYNGILWNLLI